MSFILFSTCRNYRNNDLDIHIVDITGVITSYKSIRLNRVVIGL